MANKLVTALKAAKMAKKNPQGAADIMSGLSNKAAAKAAATPMVKAVASAKQAKNSGMGYGRMSKEEKMNYKGKK